MSAPYTPKPDSLAASVVHFFSVNPDEELTLDDISDKFDAGRNNIHTQLGRAVEAGLLIRGTNDDGDYIYTAGKALLATQARTGGPAPVKSTHLRNTTKVDVDQLVLVVDKNVPMPNGTVCKKWDALFDKLTDVGDSIALPASSAAETASFHCRLRQQLSCLFAE